MKINQSQNKLKKNTFLAFQSHFQRGFKVFRRCGYLKSQPIHPHSNMTNPIREGLDKN